MLAEKLREHGFEVKLMHVPHIPIKNLKNPSFAFSSTFKALIHRGRYDIVHAFNVPAAFAMRYVKAKRKVLSVHGVYSDQVGILHSNMLSTVVNTAEPHILQWADKLTTDSKTTQKVYKERFGLEFELLPSAIDTSRFKDISEVEKVENQVAYIGRDSFEKGIDVIRKIEPKINGKVVYCTDLSWKEAMAILKASTLLVVPSRMDSLPTVIKEAHYLRVPVVATNVGDIPELITNTVSGILVPPNDEDKLVDAINLLLENKEYAKKLAAGGHEYVINNMTWDVVLQKYIQFYEKLVN